MFTVTIVFLLAAFVCTILEAMGKCPAWVSKILMLVVLMLMLLPK